MQGDYVPPLGEFTVFGFLAQDIVISLVPKFLFYLANVETVAVT